MDFMFEDDVDEVGSDVEAYCPKCKADTTHVVISKYEDEIRRVQCNPCGDVHSFRKPRGETEDDVPEPVAAKKRALLKKPGWEDFFAKRNVHDPKPYEFREAYRENAIVNHPKFGVGFVSEVVSDSKVEITFKDARRILVHNRRDIPGLPLAAEGDGVPTPVKSAKTIKAEKAAEKAAEKEAAKAEKAAEKEAAAAAKTKAKDSKPAKAEPADAKPAAGAVLKAVAKLAAPVVKAVSKLTGKAEPAARDEKKAEKKPEPKGKPIPKPVAKAAKAAPRGVKTAAKSAAKKPAPKPKKKAGKKR